jgi:hypothetical protein
MLYDRVMGEALERDQTTTDSGTVAAADVEVTAETAEPGDVWPRPSWFGVLLAPWVGLIRPQRAARMLAAGAGPAVVVTLLVSAFCVSVVVLWFCLLGFNTFPDDGGAAMGTFPQSFGGHREVFREHTPAETWAAWHEEGPIGPAEQISFFVAAGLVVLALLAAWLYLADVHQGESTSQAFKRSIAAMTSCMGLLFVLTVLGGLLIESSYGDDGPPEEIIVVIAFGAGIFFLLHCLGVAARGARGPAVNVHCDPRCEWCGYNLTHVPSTGKCTECGTDVALSLDPDLRRTGHPWENEGLIPGFVATSARILLEPTHFFRSLKLLGDERRATAFYRWHYALIAILSPIWMIACMLYLEEEFLDDELWLVAIVITQVIVLSGWGVHRFVGAIVFSSVLLRRALPEPERVRRVMAYETPYLWMFCLYNGGLITSFFVADDWMSQMVGPVYYQVAPLLLEFIAVFLGNCLIMLLWFWRYAIAIRAIRWSNF